MQKYNFSLYPFQKTLILLYKNYFIKYIPLSFNFRSHKLCDALHTSVNRVPTDLVYRWPNIAWCQHRNTYYILFLSHFRIISPWPHGCLDSSQAGQCRFDPRPEKPFRSLFFPSFFLLFCMSTFFLCKLFDFVNMFLDWLMA